MEILFWIGVLLASLYVLIKASDYFTDSAEQLGLYLKLSPFVIGVTIVALGTSLPELVSSVLAVIRGSSEIVIGNVLGSNITNIFLILGVVVVGRKLKITHELINIDLPLFVGASFLFLVMIGDGEFTLIEGLLSLAVFAIYAFYSVFFVGKRNRGEELGRKIWSEPKRHNGTLEPKCVLVIIGSLLFVFIGANYTIEAIINLSVIFDIGKEVIAASVVALGTSLPELVVSIRAAKRGKAEIAVGNILGSNIFNASVVMGVSSFFGVLIIPSGILFFGIPMFFIATLMYFFIAQDKQITRWEGWLLIVFLFVLYRETV